MLHHTKGKAKEYYLMKLSDIIQRLIRRALCIGRHKWITLDAETRQCYRCDLVRRRVANKCKTPYIRNHTGAKSDVKRTIVATEFNVPVSTIISKEPRIAYNELLFARLIVSRAWRGAKRKLYGAEHE